jgi:hypothetical protein
MLSMILVSISGQYGLRIIDASRMAEGPNLALGRKDVPVSNGTPKTATSAPLSSFPWGSRIYVLTPLKRGDFKESTG